MIPKMLELRGINTVRSTPWTQDVNLMYIRRLEDVQDVF